jgi:hypothetical protein
MCIEGVNAAQLKVSLTQAAQLAELCRKNVAEWKQVLKELESNSLAEYLEKAEDRLAESLKLLRKTLAEAERLTSHHHHDDSVTITKL